MKLFAPGRYLLFFSPHISFCDLYPILRMPFLFPAPTSIAFQGLASNATILHQTRKAEAFFS